MTEFPPNNKGNFPKVQDLLVTIRHNKPNKTTSLYQHILTGCRFYPFIWHFYPTQNRFVGQKPLEQMTVRKMSTIHWTLSPLFQCMLTQEITRNLHRYRDLTVPQPSVAARVRFPRTINCRDIFTGRLCGAVTGLKDNYKTEMGKVQRWSESRNGKLASYSPF